MNGCGPSGEKQGSPSQTLPAEEALRRSEEGLGKSEAFYRSLVENLPQNVLRKDLEGRFTYANQNFCQLVGRPLEEVLGKTDFDLYPAELAEKYRADDRAVMGSGKLLEQVEENPLPSGERRLVRVVKVPTYDAEGRPLGTQCLFWDITERKRAEEALRQSEQEHRELFEGALDAILVADAQTGILIDCNRAACKLVGRDKSELLGQHQRILHPPEEVEGEFSRTFQQHRAERAGQVLATQVITKNGEIKDVEIKASLLELQGRQMILGIFRDVTQRKRAEAALRQSEERYRSLVEAAPDVIYTVAADGRLASLSPAFERITGWPRADWIGKPFLPLVHPDDQALAVETFQQSLRGETPPVAELRILSRSGDYLVGEFTSRPQIEQGRIVGELGVARDITARKRAEAALANERNLLRTLIDGLPDTIYAKDREARKTLANRADVEAIGAQNEAAVLGKTDFDVFPPEIAAKFWADDQAVLQTGKPVINREELVVTGTGERRWLLTSKLPVRDQSGQITGLIGMGRDITEHKGAEAALRESETKFRSLAETSPVGILIHQGGRYRYVNAVFEAMTGYTREELLAMDFWEVVHPEFRELIRERGLARHRGEAVPAHYEFKVLTKAGEERWAELRATRFELEGQPAVLATVFDVTERKQAEAALKASEQRFHALIENSRDAIALLDRQGAILFFPHPAVARILGYDDRELVGRSTFDLIHPDDRQRIGGLLAQLLESPGRQIAAQMRFQHKDGSWRWLEATATNLLAEPSVQAVVINYADVTERKRAEEALATERNLLRTLIENLPDNVYAKDREARKTLVNRWDLEVIGAKNEAEVLGKTDFDLFPPEMAAKFWADDQAVLQTGKPVINREELVVSSTGERRWLLTSKLPVRDQSGQITGMIGIGRDITERKQAEEQRLNLERQVQQAQKLESLGVLAGGIAHDFNNILTAIMGNINLALMDLSPAAPAREELVEAEKATRRAADLVKQMLAYSGKGRFRVRPLDLQEVIEEMTNLLQASISKKAVLRFNFAASVPTVEADAAQMRQIIMNLVINASEAIGERSGVIAISTGVMECDQAYLASTWLREALPAGLYSYVEVADTGCGITKEQLPRIFDPFFSTKFTGRGLGLAAVLGIVRSHRGAIKVYTEPGKGSTFKVLFPAASLGAEGLNDAVSGPSRWRGSGLLLLVDDEESVRAIGKKILERLGFEVLAAADGCEALEVFRTRADAIAAVVLDLTMPHMDGEETFRELRRIRAGVRVILSSGYNEQDVVQRFVGKGLAGFVQKPYTVDNLRAALQSLFPGPALTPPAAS